MLTALMLENFRNYECLSLSFDKPVNALVGANGQGKTNLLEAIYFLAYLRSFRTTSMSNLRRIGSPGFYLSASVSTEDAWEKKLEVDYVERRRLRVDGQPIHKSTDFAREIKTIVFTHDDLSLVNGVAGPRRKFLDIYLSAMDSAYLFALKDYSIALKSRNAMLSAGAATDMAAVAAYEPIMAKAAVTLVQTRYEVIEKLSARANELAKEIKGDDYELFVDYKTKNSRARGDYDQFMRLYADTRLKDREKGYGLFGPHLDDYNFYLDKINLRQYGSLGQCRLAALCLKMAAVDVILDSREGGQNVIALVDDVTGELDPKTKKAFLRVIGRAKQAFFTFTHNEPDQDIENASVFNVEDGMVRKTEG